MGAHKAARAHADAALRLAPDDPRIANNARQMGAADDSQPTGALERAQRAGGQPSRPESNLISLTTPALGPSPRLVSITVVGDAQLIGAGLSSVVDSVTACLMFHTGTSEDALAAARGAVGAKYVEHRFDGDAAVGWNAALGVAHGLGAEWALVVAAGERIDLSRVDIRALLGDATEDVLSLTDQGDGRAEGRFLRLPATGRFTGSVLPRFVPNGAEVRELPGVRVVTMGTSPEVRLQEFEHNVSVLSAQADIHPDDPHRQYELGNALHGLGRYEEAIRAYRACASLQGWNEEAAWACYRAAECWLALGSHGEAIESCAAGLAQHAGIAELAWLAAYACYLADRFHQAIAWARLSEALGLYRGCGHDMRRLGFRNPRALWEGPYDVLRFALPRIGDQTGALEAERLFRDAATARERQG